MTTTVAPLTYRWQRRKKTNCLLYFSGFKSKKFLDESSYDRVSGTDNDEQSLKKPYQVPFIFGHAKRSPDFKTAVYFL